MQNNATNIVYSGKNYDTYLEHSKRLLEGDLLKVISKTSSLKLREKIGYVLETRGKLLRPSLVMLSAQSVGGDIEKVRKLAVAIELLHAATLVHDDVLDQDSLRRDVSTVNAKWGVRDAVLVGDALASLSFYLAVGYGKAVTRIMSRTCLLLSDGEYMDVENTRGNLKERDCITTIRRKSASLFRAAAQCGAIASNALSSEVQSLANFGENFGMAYQLKDDLSDVMGLGNTLPQDIKDFRATLPVIHLFLSLKQSEREILFQRIGSVKNQSSVEKTKLLRKLRELLRTTGTIAYCMRKLDGYLDEALRSLKPMTKTVYKDYLFQMTESLRSKPQF